MALADDLITTLGAIAPVIGWTSSTPQLTQVIARAEDIATDESGVPAVATWLMWRAVLVALSVQIDFSADKASYKLSQMFDAVQGFVSSALAEAAEFLPPGFGGGAFIADLDVQPAPYDPLQPDGEFGAAV